MATAKDVRNWILSLIILAAGIKGVMVVSQGYISNPSSLIPENLISSVESLGTLMIYGIVGLAFLLIIYYFSKRSDEKKAKKQEQVKQVVK